MTKSLKPKQFQAAYLIAQGALIRDIEMTLKLRKNTFARWLRIPTFQAEINKHVMDMQRAASYKALAMRYASMNRLHHDIEYAHEARPLEEIRKLLCNSGHLVAVNIDELRQTGAIIRSIAKEFERVGYDAEDMASGLERIAEEAQPHQDLRWQASKPVVQTSAGADAKGFQADDTGIRRL